MGIIKTSITIPDDIFEEAKNFSGNFSALVAEALREYIRMKNIQKAMQSFGTWENRGKDSISVVNELRAEEGRDHAKRNN